MRAWKREAAAAAVHVWHLSASGSPLVRLCAGLPPRDRRRLFSRRGGDAGIAAGAWGQRSSLSFRMGCQSLRACSCCCFLSLFFSILIQLIFLFYFFGNTKIDCMEIGIDGEIVFGMVCTKGAHCRQCVDGVVVSLRERGEPIAALFHQAVAGA